MFGLLWNTTMQQEIPPDKLSRVYWYTVEFGLVQQSDGLRIYGAGIASSATESVFALDDVPAGPVTLRASAAGPGGALRGSVRVHGSGPVEIQLAPVPR